MEETVLKLQGLTKKYDNKPVVDHISMEIKKGEIFGLLGPNGAGKSTTMNMICALTKPTAGSVRIFSKEMNTVLNTRQIRRRIGYIPQDIAIHGNLKAWENVELFTSLYGLKGKELKDAVGEALEFVGLSEHRNDYAKNFSGGMKRRLNIACALGHNPELLFFDEPTVGIDPQSRNFILKKIKYINSQGATVIYTSHYMEEIEAICTRIAIMDNGKIIAVGTKEELVSLVTDDLSANMSLEEVFLTLTGKKLRDYAEGDKA
ncbi:ABC-2 type transport system ATP-binding protein [Kineothrix alysoides]|uniref:ABC-2 type transport system ATP-binding protein n=1 Tax=Kineothrix alysoides TaxID=1469948 RepID=A0A4V6NGQ8_9FIRM|nr:ABC transporter ATP-binding protein [Kineothrix alysoides]TCL60457.1 ABC-2 type transport system ATP-binding protein [Kineothrix alysoides]